MQTHDSRTTKNTGHTLQPIKGGFVETFFEEDFATKTGLSYGELIGIKQLAHILDISYPSARKLVAEGRIASVRIGANWRTSLCAVDRYLSDQLLK